MGRGRGRFRYRSPGGAEQFCAGPPTGSRIGIALSGGGIRSAAFNLGALQALQKKGMLQKSSYLAAVSGGNYIGSALTISYASAAADDDRPPWATGSPEETYLRNHTDYMARGWIGRVWFGLSFVYGFLLNYLPFLLSAFLLGRALGWSLHAVDRTLIDLQFSGATMPGSWVQRSLLLVSAGLLCGALVTVVLRRFRVGGSAERPRSEPVAAAFVAFAVAGLVLAALPALAAGYAIASRWALTTVLRAEDTAFDGPVGRVEVGCLWLVLALVLAAVSLTLSRWVRATRLMLCLSALSAPALLLIPLLSSLEHAARQGVGSARDLAGPVIALAVLVTMSVFVDNRRYSLHLFYRERLNRAFALRRRPADGGRTVAEPRPYSERLPFSVIGRQAAASLPELIVCCAVNITTDVVPSGRFAESFTFTHDRSGSPQFGYHETARFERHDGTVGTGLTLPALMAVSGAALSPLMGRFTYPPMRLLMALTNVRLGVWVPSPLNEHWDELPVDRSTRWRRLRQRVVDGWREPGAYYVLREALGVLRPDSRYVYLTDGGHWENLGLVELLRRRCTHVLCFDASSDAGGAGQDIGRAMALARSDLGVEIALDPRETMTDDSGLAPSTTVLGNAIYPDDSGEARVVYAKAVLTEQSSWDLHAYRRRSSQFPNHPTSRQIFTDEQFEAYRALGFAAGVAAVDLINMVPIAGNGSTTSGTGLPRAAAGPGDVDGPGASGIGAARLSPGPCRGSGSRPGPARS